MCGFCLTTLSVTKIIQYRIVRQFFWFIMNEKMCGRKQFEHNLPRVANDDQEGLATTAGLSGRHLNSKPREYCHPLNHNKTGTSYTSIYVLKNPKLINVYTTACHLTLS